MGDWQASGGDWNDASTGGPAPSPGVGDAAPLKVDTVETNVAFVHIEHLVDGVSVAVANKRGEVVAGMMVGVDTLNGVERDAEVEPGEIFRLWGALHAELMAGPCEYIVTSPAYLKMAAIVEESRALFLSDGDE